MQDVDDSAFTDGEEGVNAAAAHLLRETQRMEEELLQARAVQRYLLPPEAQDQQDFKVAYVYHPLHHVGGDFLDTLLREDGKLVLMVGDVAGHGVAAALSSAMLKTAFLRYAPKAKGPGELLQLIDKELNSTVRFGRFVTAIVAWLDLKTRTITFSSAGHPQPILIRRKHSQLLDLEAAQPLFTGDAVEYPDMCPTALEPGDRILLMTDGVLEAVHPNGDMVEMEEITRAVEASSSTNNFAQTLYESLFFSELVFRDDVSLMMLEVK